MQELITPVQFESAVDTLNRIIKLYIPDEVHLSIDSMQASQNPVGHGHPIIGKFSKCSVGGGVCVCPVEQGYSNYEYIYYSHSGSPRCRSITFAQQVFGVSVMLTHRYGEAGAPRWETPDNNVIIKFPTLVFVWLPFRGTTLKICVEYQGQRYRGGYWGFY